VYSHTFFTPHCSLYSKKIEKGLKDAEAAERRLGEILTERQSMLHTAHKDAAQIVLGAESVASHRGQEIVTEAERRAEVLVADAKRQSEEFRRVARKESEAEVAKIAILAAEKILRDRANQ
jgi:F-type H+-transporting ATPase subunit b